MGYCYGRTHSGRSALACDSCGHVGGVRKRTCPARVEYAEGCSLPYCMPAALCAACYKLRKPTLHVGCHEQAALRTASERARRARLEAGDKEVRSAWGDWHKAVPSGYVGVAFAGLSKDPHLLGGAVEVWALIPQLDYAPGEKRFLSDYANHQPWEHHA